MADNLRRSSRRAKKRAYHVGDLVDIESASGLLLRGRLISKLTDDADSKARWLVGFDESEASTNKTEEEIYESAFGEVVGKVAGNEQAVQVPAPAVSKKNKKNASRGKHSSPSATAASTSTSSKHSAVATEPLSSKPSAVDKKKAGSNKRAAASSLVAATSSAHDGNGAAASDSSTTPSDASKKAARASAREERSKRRQALLDVDSTEAIATTRTHSTLGGSKKASVTSHFNNRPNKKPKKSPNEEVVKIPMLTGTLLLYRGVHRRAEFVRKF